MKKFLLLFILFYPLFSYCQTQHGPSQWVWWDGNGKLIYKTTEKGDRITDFSYAGYKGGGIALPDVPEKVVVKPLGNDSDCTEHIQKAIDSISALPKDAYGFRGAVLLAPGRYLCSESLTISYDGVVLRGSGSGSDGSVIEMTGPKHTAIVISSRDTRHCGNRIENFNPEVKGIKVRDRYVPAGSSSFTVEDASGLKVGDNIEIRKPVTQKWLDFMHMNDMYRDGKHETWIKSGRLLVAERVIKSIEGNKVILDHPLVDSYDYEYTNDSTTVVVNNENPRVSQCGIESLRIESPEQAVSHTVALYYAMMINGEDCWAHDVNAMETMESVRIGGRRITLQKVNVIRKALHQGSSKPAEFAPNGGQILMDRCMVEGDNIWFVATGAGQTGPIVLLNCTFHGKGHIEGHQRWSTGMLLDNCQLPDGGIDFRNRGEMGSGHGWGIAWSVAWNCTAKSYVNQNPPGAKNWVIGCRGERQLQRRPFNKTGPMLPEGTFDSHGESVEPKSLYLSQLKERLGPSALKSIGY